MDKGEFFNLEVTWKTPTVRQAFIRKDFIVVMDDGSVKNFNTDFGFEKEFDTLKEFKERVFGEPEEFDLMYERNRKLEQLAQESFWEVDKIYMGQM